jgi:manganese transport protein
VYAFSILATETAEFTGVTLGIELVFQVGLGPALGLAALAFFALLAARGTAARPLERFAVLTTLAVAIVYGADWIALHPAAAPIARGSFIPALPGPGALAAVIGIVGATIMPHNLFLHGGLIAERLGGGAFGDRRAVERFALKETVLALGIATAINAAILIVGNAAHATTIEAEFAALRSTLGQASALFFGGALIVAGLAATATGARAGDFVFGSGTRVRLTPFLRRVIGITPPALLLACGLTPAALLLVSQIALGLTLPFVVVPLLAIAAGSVRRAGIAGGSLFAASAIVGLTTLACDGNYLVSLLPH